MHNLDGEIIVVDNNSTDGSQTYFEEKFGEIIFIKNKSNEGFAKANNRALKIAHGAYILFLNPDTIVPEDCFEKCISFIKSKQNNCALGIKMLDGAGEFLKESKRAFPSPITSMYKLSGLARMFPHSTIFAKYYLGNLSENKIHEVDVLAGAFMMLPKNILDIIGGFDEDFFMYGEDIDLSFRIQKAGFKNIYFAESSIIHFKGESTKKGSLNYVKMFYRAMSIFVKKHYGNTKAEIFIFLIDVAIFFRAAFAAISGFLKLIFVPLKENFIKLLNLKKKRITSNQRKNTVIAGTEEEFNNVVYILEKAGSEKNQWGRIETGKIQSAKSLGNFDNLKSILLFSTVKEIIFCEGELSFKKIIGAISHIPHDVSIKYFAKGSHSIIGSDDKDIAGKFISGEKFRN